MKSLAMAILLPSVSWAQDTYKLEALQEKGDVYKSTRIDKFEGKSKLLDDKQSVQDDTVRSQEEMVSNNTVLESEKGKATKVQRKFDKCAFETKAFGSDKAERGKRALDGKTVTVVRVGRISNYEAPSDVPTEELERLKFADHPFVQSLPAEAIAVGNKWDIKEDVLAEFMGLQDSTVKFTKAGASCVFDKVEERNGVKCAAIKIQIKLEAAGENKLKLTNETKGTFWIALEQKRFVGMELEGEYTTQATNDDDKLVMEGSGKISLSETLTYEKFGDAR